MRVLKAAVVAAILPALLLTGCSQAAPEAPEKQKEQTEAPAPETKPAATGDRPEWAINPLDLGEKVGETQGESWSVQVFRVDNAITSTDGLWAMPDTKAPVMPTGTEMTVYNVVFTNTSSSDILIESGASVSLIHKGVEDYKATLSSHDPEMFEPFGLVDRIYDIAKLDEITKYGDERGFVVKPGESFAIASNTWAVPGDVKVEAYVNVMDENGKRLVDASEIISQTIKQ